MNEEFPFKSPYNSTNAIAIIWSVEDVKALRSDLNDEQCMEVLHNVERNHDGNYGVSWTEVKDTIWFLFNKPEDKPKQESKDD